MLNGIDPGGDWYQVEKTYLGSSISKPNKLPNMCMVFNSERNLINFIYDSRVENNWKEIRFLIEILQRRNFSADMMKTSRLWERGNEKLRTGRRGDCRVVRWYKMIVQIFQECFFLSQSFFRQSVIFTRASKLSGSGNPPARSRSKANYYKTKRYFARIVYSYKC